MKNDKVLALADQFNIGGVCDKKDILAFAQALSVHRGEAVWRVIAKDINGQIHINATFDSEDKANLLKETCVSKGGYKGADVKILFEDAAPVTPVGDEWQPIETAPKDGSSILLCMPGSTDIYIVVGWTEADPYEPRVIEGWETTYGDIVLTEEELMAGNLPPMWKNLPNCPPTSLSYKHPIPAIPEP